MRSFSRGLLLAIITSFWISQGAWAEPSSPDLIIVIDNGWTLTIRADGSARLARTRSPQLQANAPTSTFAYGDLVKSLEKGASPKGPPLTGGSYGFGTQTDLTPLPRIPETTNLLTQAQSVFQASVQPLLRQLLSRYPLITTNETDW